MVPPLLKIGLIFWVYTFLFSVTFVSEWASRVFIGSVALLFFGVFIKGSQYLFVLVFSYERLL